MHTHSWAEVMSAHITVSEQDKLSKTCVGIAGAGGLGSNCACLLARSGIGKLIIVDFDLVSLSNLNRQNYTFKHLEQPKTEALKQVLSEINPQLEIITYHTKITEENFQDIFYPCHILIEAVDLAGTKRMLLEQGIKHGKFVIGACGLAGYGGLPMQVRKLGKHAVIVGDQTSDVENLPPLAPKVMMAAAMQADQVLVRVLGAKSKAELETEHGI